MDSISNAIFEQPHHIATRAEALSQPCPVPAVAGVYGWWFRSFPADIDTSACISSGGLTLLYVGISPKQPPANGRLPSRQNLRQRIRTHYCGNAEGSTLRKTLGCLLAPQLAIELRRVGSGNRMTFGTGEQSLSQWMHDNALVSWLVCDRPWEVEDQLITTLDLPLNLYGNSANAFHLTLTEIRAACVNRARNLPVIANPGVGGR